MIILPRQQLVEELKASPFSMKHDPFTTKDSRYACASPKWMQEALDNFNDPRPRKSQKNDCDNVSMRFLVYCYDALRVEDVDADLGMFFDSLLLRPMCNYLGLRPTFEQRGHRGIIARGDDNNWYSLEPQTKQMALTKDLIQLEEWPIDQLIYVDL